MVQCSFRSLGCPCAVPSLGWHGLSPALLQKRLGEVGRESWSEKVPQSWGAEQGTERGYRAGYRAGVQSGVQSGVQRKVFAIKTDEESKVAMFSVPRSVGWSNAQSKRTLKRTVERRVEHRVEDPAAEKKMVYFSFYF